LNSGFDGRLIFPVRNGYRRQPGAATACPTRRTTARRPAIRVRPTPYRPHRTDWYVPSRWPPVGPPTRVVRHPPGLLWPTVRGVIPHRSG